MLSDPRDTATTGTAEAAAILHSDRLDLGGLVGRVASQAGYVAFMQFDLVTSANFAMSLADSVAHI